MSDRSFSSPSLLTHFARCCGPISCVASVLLYCLAYMLESGNTTLEVLAHKHRWNASEKASCCRTAGRFYVVVAGLLIGLTTLRPRAELLFCMCCTRVPFLRICISRLGWDHFFSRGRRTANSRTALLATDEIDDSMPFGVEVELGEVGRVGSFGHSWQPRGVSVDSVSGGGAVNTSTAFPSLWQQPPPLAAGYDFKDSEKKGAGEDDHFPALWDAPDTLRAQQMPRSELYAMNTTTTALTGAAANLMTARSPLLAEHPLQFPAINAPVNANPGVGRGVLGRPSGAARGVRRRRMLGTGMTDTDEGIASLGNAAASPVNSSFFTGTEVAVSSPAMSAEQDGRSVASGLATSEAGNILRQRPK